MLGGVEKLPPDLRCFQIPTKLFECGFDRYVCAYDFRVKSSGTGTGNLSPVSIQTQSLALASSQSWLLLLRPSILLAAACEQLAVNRMLGRSSGNHDWLLANASDSVWMEPGFSQLVNCVVYRVD